MTLKKKGSNRVQVKILCLAYAIADLKEEALWEDIVFSRKQDELRLKVFWQYVY